MMITTHAWIAMRETKGYFSLGKRIGILLGSILPDMVSSTLPHRGENLKNHIETQEEKIRTTRSVIGKYMHLGQLLHYLCDYFCYAHQDGMPISHGIRHTIYEWKLAHLYHSGAFPFPKKLPLNKDTSLKQYFSAMRSIYDSLPVTLDRDVSYSLYAVHYCFEYIGSHPTYDHYSRKKRTQMA